MFGRLLWNLLRGSRARLGVALVALVSGAAVISALINLDLDVERKLAREFRSLGANLVLAPPRSGEIGATSPALMDESIVMRLDRSRPAEVVSLAPYLYLVARADGQPVVVAGTWLDEAKALEPWWQVQGERIASREDQVRCLVGEKAARQLRVVPGSELGLRYQGRETRLTVAGIVTAGGTEDNQVFVNLAVAQRLAGLPGRVELAQLGVEGTARAIERYAKQLAEDFPGLEVRPIRRVAEAEGQLLGRIRLLILLTVVLILALTALCVLATMAALAMERRQDVGLMKALGGPISRVVGLFLAEVGVLGAAGGLIGFFVGLGLSDWMGRQVFGVSISPRLEVLPLTVALMVGVSLAGAMPLRLLGKVRPAVILRGE